MTVKELIQKHGGIAAVRKRSGFPAQTISNWILRNRIPVQNWPKLVASGVDQADLMEIHVIRHAAE